MIDRSSVSIAPSYRSCFARRCTGPFDATHFVQSSTNTNTLMPKAGPPSQRTTRKHRATAHQVLRPRRRKDPTRTCHGSTHA